MLDSGWPYHRLYHTDDFAFVPVPDKATRISMKEMERLSHHQSPQNALIVATIPQSESVIPHSGLQLYLDGIRDPGNLGTILRIADWYGLDQVWCSEDTVEVFNPKCIDASMGSFLRVKVHTRNATEFLEACALPAYAAVMNGESVHGMTFPGDALLIIGNEGKGISPLTLRGAHTAISIPRFGGAESLNAGVATAILLDNFRRSG